MIFEATLHAPFSLHPPEKTKRSRGHCRAPFWAAHSASCHQLPNSTSCQLTLGPLSAQIVEAENLLTLLPSRNSLVHPSLEVPRRLRKACLVVPKESSQHKD